LSAFCLPPVHFLSVSKLGNTCCRRLFCIYKFFMTVTMQIRKNILLALIILVAFLLVVSVYIFFNRRIQQIENKRQAPHSENLQILQSTSNLKLTSRL
jgi:hypothetical protein